MRLWPWVVAVFVMLPLAGCMKEEATATQSEEQAYRNPSKEPPPEASQGIGAPPQTQGGGQ